MLNSEQMLPARVREMRQMCEILDVEDIIFAELDRVLNEISQRASYLHEELVNEKWLETQIQKITGGVIEVAKSPNDLLVEILINHGQLSGSNPEAVIHFLNKWLPAHLAYRIIYEKILSAENYYTLIWQDDEIMTLRQVII